MQHAKCNSQSATCNSEHTTVAVQHSVHWLTETHKLYPSHAAPAYATREMRQHTTKHSAQHAACSTPRSLQRGACTYARTPSYDVVRHGTPRNRCRRGSSTPFCSDTHTPPPQVHLPGATWLVLNSFFSIQNSFFSISSRALVTCQRQSPWLTPIWIWWHASVILPVPSPAAVAPWHYKLQVGRARRSAAHSLAL
jgi:hypothetical protein